jgi:hypothetical protein
VNLPYASQAFKFRRRPFFPWSRRDAHIQSQLSNPPAIDDSNDPDLKPWSRRTLRKGGGQVGQDEAGDPERPGEIRSAPRPRAYESCAASEIPREELAGVTSEEATRCEKGGHLSGVESTKGASAFAGGGRPENDQVRHHRVEAPESGSHFVACHDAATADGTGPPASPTPAGTRHLHARQLSGDLGGDQPAEGRFRLHDDDARLGRSVRPAPHQPVEIPGRAALAALGAKELGKLRLEAPGTAIAETRSIGLGRSVHEDAASLVPTDETEPVQVRIRREYGVSMETQKIRQPPTAGKPPTCAQLARSDRGCDLRRQLLTQGDRVPRRECQLSDRVRRLGWPIRAADGASRVDLLPLEIPGCSVVRRPQGA